MKRFGIRKHDSTTDSTDYHNHPQITIELTSF